MTAWVAICGFAAALSAAPPRAPVASPPGPRTGGLDDRWLSQIALDELRSAAETAQYARTADRFELACLERLSCGIERLDNLSDVVFATRACRYLAMAENLPEGKKFAAWLLENRNISRLMFRAMGEVKSPEDSLRKLQELVNADEKVVREYADLAVAFATSQALKHERDQPAAASMLDSFRWYTDPKLKFRYDLKKLPYELLRYLADTRLSVAERRWAMNQYGGSNDPAQSYFQVDYDMDHLTKGTPKKNEAVPYSLDNLRRLGGVCADQAYYSAEVCKAVGVPASVVFGRGGSGVPHSWVACLKGSSGGRGVRWDVQTARYAEHHYFIGVLRDPASGEELYDSVLRLYGEAAQLPLQQREEADAAVALARLVEKSPEAYPAGGGKEAATQAAPAATLRKLAEAYDRKHAAEPNAPKAGTNWLGPKRKIAPDLVEDLLAAAIQRNLAERQAWDFLVELRKRDHLPVGRLDRFFDVLMAQTAVKYPDFMYLMVMRTVPTIPDADRREGVYKKVLEMYGKRPDLYGRILIAMGDDYRQQGKKDAAIQAYRQAANKSVQVAEIVVKAAQRAEELFGEANRRDQAIEMYQQLFAKVKKDDQAGIFRTQTSHYQLGQRLADLLKSAGQTEAAKKIAAVIEG